MELLKDELSRDIWKQKYQYNNETEDEWFKRVAGGNRYIENLIRQGKFLFAGRILANRGLDKIGKKITYSNCYVLSTKDSIEDIYKTCSDLARTFSYGGGVGIDITPLRPSGLKVNNSAETTSGAVSFMPTFSQVAETIGQKGRRGALMLSMSCEHPDIEEFIDAKANSDKITKANISVRVTDEFMRAVIEEKMYTCKFELETGEVIKKEVNAKKLFRKLCENNWDYAEPGILFWDRIREYNLLQHDENFEFAGVNPCAEEPLPDGGSCLLGSINLSKYVEGIEFNFNEFKKDIYIIVNAMDEVLDEGLALHPLEIQRKTVSDYRQMGIGIMGLADMLIKMRVRYGSEESLKICSEIGHILAQTALKASAELARGYGHYPKYTDAIMRSDFFNRHRDNELWDLVDAYGLRHSQILCIAPTGSISNMLGVSGGIEPIFANSYTRKTESLHGEEKYYKVYTPIVKEYMETHNIEKEEYLPNFFITAQNLDPMERIEMQATWQNHIDASISSTINLPYETTIDDVEYIYTKAWSHDLKGLTIYRDGCKRGAVLKINKKKDEIKTEENNFLLGRNNRGEIKNISIEDCIAKGKKLTTGCGTLWLTAYFDKENGELQHIFLDKGSKGGCNSFMCGLSRMISIAARGGVSLDDIIDQLQSTVGCNSYYGRTLLKKDTSCGNSCPSAIGNALKSMGINIKSELNITNGEQIEKPLVKNDNEKCPVCGNELIRAQGCTSCLCGYSKCD